MDHNPDFTSAVQRHVLKFKKNEWAFALPFLLTQTVCTCLLCGKNSPGSQLGLFALVELTIFALCTLQDVVRVYTKSFTKQLLRSIG
jgi:hypothetical protein